MSTISETERLFQALHAEVNGVNNKMDNSKKVAIRGSEKYGADIINYLISLGGNNNGGYSGKAYYSYYFIDHNNNIDNDDIIHYGYKELDISDILNLPSYTTCDNCESIIDMDNTTCEAFDGTSCCEECIEDYEFLYDNNYDEDEDYEIHEESKPSFTTEEMFKNVSIALGDIPTATSPLNTQIIKGNDYSKQLEELSKRRKKY